MWGQASAYKLAEDIAKKQKLKERSRNNSNSKASSPKTMKKPRKPVFVSGEDVSVSSSVTDTNTTTNNGEFSRSRSETGAETFVLTLKEAIDEQKKQEGALDIFITEQIKLAKARQNSGNNLGAILCMKKVKRFQFERMKVTVAIDTLETHMFDITSELSKERTLTSLDSGEHNVSVDVDLHKSYVSEIDAILSQPNPETKYTDADLLKELVSL